MPTLKHLIEELQKLAVEPDEVRLPGQMYDDIVDQAEGIVDEQEQEQEQE